MKRWIKSHFSLLVFLCLYIWLFVFYTQIHPVYVFSGDDWTYISNGRSAIPSLSEWNPSRIFPETMMPVIAAFAIHVVNVFVHDYMFSLTITFAAFISVFICCYLFIVYRFLRKLYQLDNIQAGIITVVFLFFHYFAFASSDMDNLHLLYIYDLTNCFYYTLPTLLNISLILLFSMDESDGNKWSEAPPLRLGLMCLLTYLAIFSNLFSGYVLAMYSVIYLADKIIDKRKNGIKVSFSVLLRECAPAVLIFALFALSMFLDANGTRAENIDRSFALGHTLSVLVKQLWHIKKLFLMIIILLAGIMVFICNKDKKKEYSDNKSMICLRAMGKSAIYAGLSLIWIVTLSTASNPMYIQRMDVLLGPAFFVVFAVTNMIAFLIRRYPKILAVLPLFLFIGASLIWSIEGRTFQGETNPRGWIALENRHIDQFIEADQAGKSVVRLELTDIYEEQWMGDRIARAMYKHGITKKQLKVDPVFNPALRYIYQIRSPHMPWSE